MTEISLKSPNHTMIFGLKGTGKSTFLQYALREHPMYSAHLLYDTVREHDVPGINRYLPTHRRGSEAREELDHVLSAYVTDNRRERRPEIVAVEEISRFCGPNSPPPDSLSDLVDLARHYGVGVIGVARRPAQVHTDLIEMASQLVIYRLTGKNDYRRLEQEVDGLGDAVRSLDDYQYVHVSADRSYRKMSKVPEMDTTGRL